MSEPRHRSVDSFGLPIHCLEWGDPAGEPLVLVHGFLDLAFSWTPFVAELQRRNPRPLWIVAPDCRGHGEQRAARQPPNRAEECETMCGVR